MMGATVVATVVEESDIRIIDPRSILENPFLLDLASYLTKDSVMHRYF